jgi:hypothetical protein
MLESLSKQRQKAEAQLLRAQTAEAYCQLLLKGSAAPQAAATAAAAAAAAASAAAAAAQKLLQCTVAEDSVRDTVRPATFTLLHPQLSLRFLNAFSQPHLMLLGT